MRVTEAFCDCGVLSDATGKHKGRDPYIIVIRAVNILVNAESGLFSSHTGHAESTRRRKVCE